MCSVFSALLRTALDKTVSFFYTLVVVFINFTNNAFALIDASCIIFTIKALFQHDVNVISAQTQEQGHVVWQTTK